MAGLIQAPKGTKDVVPARVHQWQYVEGVLRRTAREFGFTEIRFPVFEYTELFFARHRRHHRRGAEGNVHL